MWVNVGKWDIHRHNNTSPVQHSSFLSESRSSATSTRPLAPLGSTPKPAPTRNAQLREGVYPSAPTFEAPDPSNDEKSNAAHKET